MLHLHRLDHHEDAARLDRLAERDRHTHDHTRERAREAAACDAGAKLALARIFEQQFLVRVPDPQVHACAAAQCPSGEAARADAHCHGRIADTELRKRDGRAAIHARPHGACALKLQLHDVTAAATAEADVDEGRKIRREAIAQRPGVQGRVRGGRCRTEQGREDERLGRSARGGRDPRRRPYPGRRCCGAPQGSAGERRTRASQRSLVRTPAQ